MIVVQHYNHRLVFAASWVMDMRNVCDAIVVATSAQEFVGRPLSHEAINPLVSNNSNINGIAYTSNKECPYSVKSSQ